MIIMILVAVFLIAAIFFGLRFWGQVETKSDVKVLNELKAAAESGVSLSDVLSKASQNDYVLNKLVTSDATKPEIQIDNKLAWDQITALDETVIRKLSQIKNGTIELRRRAGGYFLTIEILEEKITSVTVAGPSE